MTLFCCYPKCVAQVLHIYESEWILIELPNQTVQTYWLCGACTPQMRLVYDPNEGGVKIVPRLGAKKPVAGETVGDGDSTRKAA
jgi:hypothetical protein